MLLLGVGPRRLQAQVAAFLQTSRHDLGVTECSLIEFGGLRLPHDDSDTLLFRSPRPPVTSTLQLPSMPNTKHKILVTLVKSRWRVREGQGGSGRVRASGRILRAALNLGAFGWEGREGLASKR